MIDVSFHYHLAMNYLECRPSMYYILPTKLHPALWAFTWVLLIREILDYTLLINLDQTAGCTIPFGVTEKLGTAG